MWIPKEALLTTGAICSTYEVSEVLIAVGMTALVVFALTMFAMQTKIDFTAWGGGRLNFKFPIIAGNGQWLTFIPNSQ